jgi:hypothetical protein
MSFCPLGGGAFLYTMIHMGRGSGGIGTGFIEF